MDRINITSSRLSVLQNAILKHVWKKMWFVLFINARVPRQMHHTTLNQKTINKIYMLPVVSNDITVIHRSRSKNAMNRTDLTELPLMISRILS